MKAVKLPAHNPESAWARLKWRWFMLTIDSSLKYYYFKQRLRYRLLCKRGWHKMGRCYMSKTNSKGKYLSVHYLECHNCKTVYFITKRQKNNYLRLKESRRDTRANAFEQIEPGAKEALKKARLAPGKKRKIKVKEI